MKYKINKKEIGLYVESDDTPHKIYRKSWPNLLFSKSYISQTDKTERMFQFQFSFLRPMIHTVAIPK
jgi:hypothetical protein